MALSHVLDPPAVYCLLAQAEASPQIYCRHPVAVQLTPYPPPRRNGQQIYCKPPCGVFLHPFPCSNSPRIYCRHPCNIVGLLLQVEPPIKYIANPRDVSSCLLRQVKAARGAKPLARGKRAGVGIINRADRLDRCPCADLDILEQTDPSGYTIWTRSTAGGERADMCTSKQIAGRRYALTH